MTPEAELEQTEHGLAPRSAGWYVLNMRDAEWRHRDGRGAVCVVGDDFEGRRRFEQLGINPFVLAPGEAMSLYHWEADQEDFLVVSGEAVVLIEGEERPLKQWDFVHCPPGAKHTIVGGPCVVLAVGARDASTGDAWGAYPVDDAAIRHGAGVEQETTVPAEAYAAFGPGRLTAYGGWLP